MKDSLVRWHISSGVAPVATRRGRRSCPWCRAAEAGRGADSDRGVGGASGCACPRRTGGTSGRGGTAGSGRLHSMRPPCLLLRTRSHALRGSKGMALCASIDLPRCPRKRTCGPDRMVDAERPRRRAPHGAASTGSASCGGGLTSRAGAPQVRKGHGGRTGGPSHRTASAEWHSSNVEPSRRTHPLFPTRYPLDPGWQRPGVRMPRVSGVSWTVPPGYAIGLHSLLTEGVSE
jgi:hypothetical protein